MIFRREVNFEKSKILQFKSKYNLFTLSLHLDNKDIVWAYANENIDWNFIPSHALHFDSLLENNTKKINLHMPCMLTAMFNILLAVRYAILTLNTLAKQFPMQSQMKRFISVPLPIINR